jgi:hypothetical protein
MPETLSELSILPKSFIRRRPKKSFQIELRESSDADQAAAEGEEGVVDVGAAFVADEQSFEVAQPGEGSLDPAVTAEAGARARSGGVRSLA